jgi:hypothetical protein
MVSRDNALFDAVQELLAIYMPLQQDYFDAAYAHALQLQADANAAEAHRPKGHHHPVAEETSFMDAITNFYGSKLQTGSTGAPGTAALETALAGSADFAARLAEETPNVDLIDDVFFFVRIAVHRAMGTRNANIASAVFIGVSDLLQSKVIPEIASHIVVRRESAHHHAAVPPKTLRWLQAATNCAPYLVRIAGEMYNLATEVFHLPDELVRFHEHKKDFEGLAESIRQQLRQWSAKVSHTLASSMTAKLDKLHTTSFLITEDELMRNDLCDPWAQQATAHWTTTIDYLSAFLSEETRDAVMVDACEAIALSIEDILWKKAQYTPFGALQVDKDLRVVRRFFTEKIDRPVRDKFSRLCGMVAILLADSAQEVALLSESDPFVQSLTPDERRKCFAMRSGIDSGGAAKVGGVALKKE